MQKEANAGSTERGDANVEELHDTLIAISVVAKRLAKRISDGEEVKAADGTDERTQ